jgi:hypothetical protein
VSAPQPLTGDELAEIRQSGTVSIGDPDWPQRLVAEVARLRELTHGEEFGVVSLESVEYLTRQLREYRERMRAAEAEVERLRAQVADLERSTVYVADGHGGSWGPVDTS